MTNPFITGVIDWAGVVAGLGGPAVIVLLYIQNRELKAESKENREHEREQARVTTQIATDCVEAIKTMEVYFRERG
jgi:hypothetical protein